LKTSYDRTDRKKKNGTGIHAMEKKTERPKRLNKEGQG
jgi:hypothetical protein